MERRAAMAVLLFAGFAAGGCADLMNRSTVAPEWFQAKAKEVEGEGYPKLADVPVERGATDDRPVWEAEAEGLRAEAQTIETETASDATPPTAEEIRAKAAQLRALTEKGSAPPDGATP
ncbi:MAG: hypothetical protein SGJ21_14185 [Alphaproteobacteria bacterium]|nr:hypothetical protein [Alphaproteobacteria bacterium]